MGTVIALLVLEGLHRETGRLGPGQLLSLGPDVRREPKYVEEDEDPWPEVVRTARESIPIGVLWAVVLLAMFGAVRAKRIVAKNPEHDWSARRRTSD